MSLIRNTYERLLYNDNVDLREMSDVQRNDELARTNRRGVVEMISCSVGFLGGSGLMIQGAIERGDITRGYIIGLGATVLSTLYAAGIGIRTSERIENIVEIQLERRDELSESESRMAALLEMQEKFSLLSAINGANETGVSA